MDRTRSNAARIRCSTGPSQSVFFLHFLVLHLRNQSIFSHTFACALSLSLSLFFVAHYFRVIFHLKHPNDGCVSLLWPPSTPEKKNPHRTARPSKNGQNVIIVGEYRVFNPNIYPPRTRSTPAHNNNNNSNGTVFPHTHTHAPCGPYAQQTGV